MNPSLDETSPELMEQLRALADNYGALGVLDTAAQMWPDAEQARQKMAAIEPAITAAGGWCAPISIPLFSVPRGGIHFPTPEEEAANKARHDQMMHDNRWKRRRNLAKGWLLLRPIRNRIHDHIHRNCEDY